MAALRDERAFVPRIGNELHRPQPDVLTETPESHEMGHLTTVVVVAAGVACAGLWLAANAFKGDRHE